MSDNPQAGTATLPDEDDEGNAAIEAIMGDAEPDDDGSNQPPATTAAGEEDPEDEAQDGEQDETEDEQPGTVRLSDGTEVTLSEVEEWRQGNLRQGDYTRKTQELAEKRREIEQHVATYTNKVQQIDRAFQIVIQAGQASLPPQPDPTLMQPGHDNYDPLAYVGQKAAYDNAVANLQTWIASKQQFDNQQKQEQQQAFRQWAENERQLAQQKVPELRDPSKATALRDQFVKYAPQYGFSAQDVSQLWDHRYIALARDAVRYRELMAKKPKTQGKQPGQQQAPQVQKPGARKSARASDVKAKRDQWNRLKATGSKEHAVDIIEDLLAPPQR